jgi:hypothetical protein
MEEQNKIVTVVELNTQQAQQELVKLNATVSNSTKDLEERIEAKNKAIQIQNDLAKKSIALLENERRTLEGRGATEKQLNEIFIKLNAAKLEALKVSEKSKVELDKLTAAQDKNLKKTQELEGGVKSLRVQLREALVNQSTLSQKYGESSAEAIKAAKAVAQLKDQIQFNSDLVAGFDPDQKFKALGAATQIAATGLQGVTAGMALFGETGEQTEKVLLQVQAAMSFSQALQQLSSLGDQYQVFKTTVKAAYLSITAAKTADTVATEANIAAENQSTLSKIKSTVVTGALTVATGIATAAQWLWNAAIMANPIVGLIALIAAAAAGIYLFTKMLMDSSEANEQASAATQKLEKQLDKESLTLKKAGESVREKNKQTLAMAKANGESTESIRKLEKKLIDEQIATDKASAMTARNTFIQERNNLAKLKASGASDEVIKAREKEVEVAYQTFQRENKQLDQSYKQRQQLIKDQEVEIAAEKTAARKKAEEDARKAAEDAKKKAEQDAKDRKTREEKEAKEALELLKRQKAAEISIAETKIAETKAKDPKADTLQAEKELLDKKREYELLNDQLIADEKIAIRLKYDEQVLELDLKQAEEKRKIIEENYKLEQELKLADLEARQEIELIEFEKHQSTILEKNAFDIAQLQEKSRLELENTQLTEAERLKIRNDTENQIAIMNKQAEAANKKSVDQQASDGIDALAESFGVAKEVALAKMIIAAPEAIANSFKNAAASYVPPLSIVMGALGAATTVIPIVKGLADIKKARFSGKGSNKGNSGGGGSASISAPTGGTAAATSIGNLAANNAAQLGVDPSITGAATSQAAANVSAGKGPTVVFSEGNYSDFKKQVEFKEQKTSI